MVQITSRRIAAGGLSFAIDEAGEGEDLALLLHGFPEARQAWRGLTPALAQMGWRAVAPDLRGYGDSDRPAGRAAYAIEALVGDVAGLFASLGPARRRILIGHDWGGVIAWQAALRRAAPLDGLIIVNAPHPAAFRRELARGWRQRLRSWYVAWFQLPLLPEAQLAAGRGAGLAAALKAQFPGFPKDLLDLYRANIARPGAARAMLDYYRANARALTAAGQGEGIIDAPTLLVWGEKDAALDLALTEGLEAWVPNLTVRRLPGVSHWVPEEAPEALAAAVREWLGG